MNFFGRQTIPDSPPPAVKPTRPPPPPPPAICPMRQAARLSESRDKFKAAERANSEATRVLEGAKTEAHAAGRVCDEAERKYDELHLKRIGIYNNMNDLRSKYYALLDKERA